MEVKEMLQLTTPPNDGGIINVANDQAQYQINQKCIDWKKSIADFLLKLTKDKVC